MKKVAFAIELSYTERGYLVFNFGDILVEVTPVPIPNTAVKGHRGDDTRKGKVARRQS